MLQDHVCSPSKRKHKVTLPKGEGQMGIKRVPRQTKKTYRLIHLLPQGSDFECVVKWQAVMDGIFSHRSKKQLFFEDHRII